MVLVVEVLVDVDVDVALVVEATDVDKTMAATPSYLLSAKKLSLM